MPKTHPPYSAEYRRRMVEQVRAGRSLKQLAREFEPSVESGRHAHRWAAEKRGGRRGAKRRGHKSKTFKLSSPTLRSSAGWGRKAGLRPTLMRKVGGC